METIKLRITSCDNLIQEIDKCKMVVIPGEDGECGIMFGHVPIITTLLLGCIRVYLSGNDDKISEIFCVNEGVASYADGVLDIVGCDIVLKGDKKVIDAAIKDAKSQKDDKVVGQYEEFLKILPHYQ